MKLQLRVSQFYGNPPQALSAAHLVATVTAVDDQGKRYNGKMELRGKIGTAATSGDYTYSLDLLAIKEQNDNHD